jgi:adenylate cyclase
MSKLVYHPGLADQKTFELVPGSYTIGRAPECDIYVAGKSLSRRHATVEVRDKRAVLVDLQSKNGTFANGLRVERRELEPGDALKLGELELSYVTDGAKPGASPSTGGESRTQSSAAKPTLVMTLSRVAFEDSLSPEGEGGALEVRAAPGEKGERRAEDKLQVLLQISQMLSRPEDPDALLRKILDLVSRTLDVDRGAVAVDDARDARVLDLQPRVAGDHDPRAGAIERVVADLAAMKPG